MLTAREEQEFCDAYLAAALWSAADYDTGGNLDDRFTWRDCCPERLAALLADCRAFIAENWACFDLLAAVTGAVQHGHDFSLTRDGHGAGFWDRGYGAKGEILSERAAAYGPQNLTAADFEDMKTYTVECTPLAGERRTVRIRGGAAPQPRHAFAHEYTEPPEIVALSDGRVGVVPAWMADALRMAT